MNATGHPLVIGVASDLRLLETDSTLAERALEILVGNVSRFSPNGSPVRITAGVAGDAVKVLVIDRGPGIRREHCSTLHEPMHCVKENGGATLGLRAASGAVLEFSEKRRFSRRVLPEP
ncbi:MAG: ATP-binding protein [Acidimicrobiales bacterium]